MHTEKRRCATNRQTGLVRLLAVALAVMAAPLLAQAEPLRFDLVLKGGKLIDGIARTIASGDLGIRDGRIAAIGEFDVPPGTPLLHLNGLHVAPGFVDVHGHADAQVIRRAHCRNFLLMGVTTLITGNCGSSVQDLAKHYDRIERGGIGINYGSLVGHATVRRAVLGTADRAPNPAELERMQGLVQRAMDAGAFGLSTGLIYVPGTYAKTEEIAALAKIASAAGGFYVSHMRNENDHMTTAIEEALAIGEAADCAVHISHIKNSGKKNHGRSTEMLEMLRRARAKGVRVTADQYAYAASSTGLDVLFPTAELDVGREEFARKLASDQEYRARIHAGLLQKMDRVGFGDFSYCRIASARGNAKLNGKLIPEAAAIEFGEGSRERQADLAIKLFCDAAPSRVSMVYHVMADRDVDAYMQQDWIAVASDAGVRSLSGTSRPHPRGAGNNARVLARFVRDRSVIDLATAVHKMSSLPAAIFGLHDRGALRVGAFADLVVFDPEKVRDMATFQAPIEPPVGIAHVFVNGQLAVSDGKLTGLRAGMVLRRPGTASSDR